MFINMRCSASIVNHLYIIIKWQAHENCNETDIFPGIEFITKIVLNLVWHVGFFNHKAYCKLDTKNGNFQIQRPNLFLKKKQPKKTTHKHKIHHTSFVIINHELKYNLYTTPIILPHKNHTWINVYIYYLCQ